MKKSVSTYLVMILLFNLSFGQELPAVHQEEKIYKEVDDFKLTANIFYTSGTRHKDNNPTIAFFHGGGWVFGSPDEFNEACKRYARKGFVTISFQYRLSRNDDGSYPRKGVTPVESVKDARSAIRWLRENVDELRIDPEKIVVAGQSAGGQLALSTALINQVNEDTDNLTFSPVPNALLLYSSTVNTMEAWVDMILGDRRDEIWSISPYHNLRKDMPPILSFHGEADCTVLPYTVDFFRRKMVELGNHYELITLEGRDHYLGEGNEKYARYFDEDLLDRTDMFLKELGFME
jgi:acetyl esterase